MKTARKERKIEPLQNESSPKQNRHRSSCKVQHSNLFVEKKKETGREIAMMKEHGKVHRQQTPVPSHSIHSGDAVEERTEGRKCPEVSVFHHASLRDGELVNGCISCMPPKPAPEQKKVERKKTQGEKIRVTKGF
jgi:hypothetical protein